MAVLFLSGTGGTCPNGTDSHYESGFRQVQIEQGLELLRAVSTSPRHLRPIIACAFPPPTKHALLTGHCPAAILISSGGTQNFPRPTKPTAKDTTKIATPNPIRMRSFVS